MDSGMIPNKPHGSTRYDQIELPLKSASANITDERRNAHILFGIFLSIIPMTSTNWRCWIIRKSIWGA